MNPEARGARSNNPAVTSLVAGLVGWLVYIFGFFLDALVGAATAGIGALCLWPLDCVPPILWLVAILSGHAALRRVARQGAPGRGLAVTGLIAGYLGWGLLVGLAVLVVVLVVSGLGLGWLTRFIHIPLPVHQATY